MAGESNLAIHWNFSCPRKANKRNWNCCILLFFFFIFRLRRTINQLVNADIGQRSGSFIY